MPSDARTPFAPTGENVPPPPGLQAPSERARAFWPQLRSRSRGRSNGAARSSGQQQPSFPSIAEMMHQQLQLLQEQTSLLRKQSETNAISAACFHSTQDFLLQVEPSLRPVLVDWLREFKSNIAAYVTHCDLSAKYAKVTSENELLKQFAQEAKRKWQFPKAYLAVAVPIEGVDATISSSTEGYNVEASWEALRLKHAKECQDFVVKHQAEAKKVFEKLIQTNVVKRSMDEKFMVWNIANNEFLTSNAATHAKQQCQKFAELAIREELPKARSRVNAEADRRKKEHEALLHSETVFQQLDAHELVTFIELSKHSTTVTNKDGTETKHLTIPKSSTLAALLKKFPNVANMFSIRFTAKTASNRTKSRSGSAKSRPASVKSTRSNGTSRSGSVRSARSGKSLLNVGFRSSQQSKPTRSASRGRSRSASGNSFKSATSRRSRRSVHSNRADSIGKGTKPKGKGKHNYKGNHKGKGRGKHSRNKSASAHRTHPQS
jgi:hypothetical protein